MELKDGNLNHIRIGLTGGFGTGKSTVADIFRELGAYVVDADELARDNLSRDKKEYQEVVSVFGEQILDREGRIDRKALADEVFKDADKLSRLNQIIHPGVIKEIEKRLVSSRSPVRIAVIPLLFETGLAPGFEYLIVVTADREIMVQRVAAVRYMSEAEIDLRRQAQLPLGEKEKQADFIIDNNGSIEETRDQVKLIWKKITKNLKV